MAGKVSRTGVLAALIAAPTIKQAARWCHVSERTMHVMAREPEIAEGLAEARQVMADQAMNTVLKAVTRAVRVLEKIMQDEDAPPMTRVIAAKSLLDGSLRAVGIQDTTKRLNGLERRLSAPMIIDDLDEGTSDDTTEQQAFPL